MYISDLHAVPGDRGAHWLQVHLLITVHDNDYHEYQSLLAQPFYNHDNDNDNETNDTLVNKHTTTTTNNNNHHDDNNDNYNNIKHGHNDND